MPVLPRLCFIAADGRQRRGEKGKLKRRGEGTQGFGGGEDAEGDFFLKNKNGNSIFSIVIKNAHIFQYSQCISK